MTDLTLHIHSDLGWKGLPAPRSFRTWIELALKGAKRRRATEINVLITDADTGRALNRDFRGKDYATNVLTFVQDGSPLVDKASTGYAADIAICAPVIAREAREQKKAVHDHHAHMVVHGMLHAQGFDHEDATEAAAMEAIEIAVLKRFRIKNPYETE